MSLRGILAELRYRRVLRAFSLHCSRPVNSDSPAKPGRTEAIGVVMRAGLIALGELPAAHCRCQEARFDRDTGRLKGD
jgi:hypothetical protein